MATIGQALTSPETGWQRIANANTSLTYTGSWTNYSTYKMTSTIGSSMTFSFTGNKLRIIGQIESTANNRCDNMEVKIDGVVYANINEYGTPTVDKALIFEKTDLSSGKHTVVLTHKGSIALAFMFDSIDIDSNEAMVTIQTGQALTSVETGWKRYDNTDSRIIYNGSWSLNDNTSWYNNTDKITVQNGASFKFRFYGTKFRLIESMASNRSTSVNISIDGVITNFSMKGNTDGVGQILYYEKLGLQLGVHTIEVINMSSLYLGLDAIDIDTSGYLVHQTLNQVSDISVMKIGDCIPCRYVATTSGAVGVFSELGTCNKNEIPVTGSATPDGLFYFIKADKGLLIADRVIQHSISWDSLNTGKCIEGLPIAFTKIVEEIPQLSSNNDLGYVVSASGTYDGGTTYSGWKAFNKTNATTTDRWISPTSACWLQIALPTAKAFNKYYITSIPTGAGGNQSPKDWKIQGSNNGSTWVDLDTRTAQTTWVVNEKKSFVITNPNSYLYYKINISSDNGAGYVSIGELEFVVEENLFQISNFLIRSLSGGVAYADANGNKYTTDQSKGAFPSNNEWDMYIVNSDLGGKITKGDDGVWHWSNLCSMCMETPYTVLSANTNRIMRGVNLLFNTSSNLTLSSATGTTRGFRPVLIYTEPNSKGTTLWY